MQPRKGLFFMSHTHSTREKTLVSDRAGMNNVLEAKQGGDMRHVWARCAVIVGVVILLGRPGQARAEESKKMVCPICGHATEGTVSYPTKAGKTLVRGAANTLLGWTELIRQPAQEAKAGGNVFMGIGKGVGEGVKRTLAGVGEILTFWTPKVQDHYVHFANDCPLCMGKQTAEKP